MTLSALHRGAEYLTGENLKVVWAKFSTLFYIILLYCAVSACRDMQPLLELKTQPRVHPVSLSVSMIACTRSFNNSWRKKAWVFYINTKKYFYQYNEDLDNPLCSKAGNTKGGSTLYHWPPVWLVWDQLYDNWQFLFLFAKQTNPNQSNRRSTVQWYFPLSYSLSKVMSVFYPTQVISMSILQSLWTKGVAQISTVSSIH